MLPTKFGVNWPFGSGEEAKNRFSSWRPSWISDRHDFSYFCSKSQPNASYQVWSRWAFLFRRRSEKQIFHMVAMSAILDSDRNDFSYFWSTSHPDKSPWCFLLSFESVGLWVYEKKLKIDFQDGRHGGHLGRLISTILAIFDLQATLMLPTKFGVNWPFGSGEAKNRFSRWQSWWPSWIFDQHNFSYFCSTSHPDASYQVWSQLAFLFRRRSEKQIFKMAAMAAILDFRSERF